ncbi:metallophosphoesterase [Salibacter sp.]|uniref:metallophosphoesterase family protein n=1 Tax=Salibacter sp. TaxID=2010995 RepID=UPI00286FB439|nr:metallophosphoesterase [Salibacter sp.]MDR9398295.1 metallophosphoesterase [Salibacter sp.]MDR9487695.1 metallophosphoesterase [Salibacter sp.]
MKANKILYLLFATSLFMQSCDKFEYNHYQVDLSDEYMNINQQNINQLRNSGSDTIKLALIGDSQRFYEGASKAVDRINQIRDIDFIIHTGDLVDFGTQKEYKLIHDVLKQLNAPYITVIGNHDLIGNGSKVFREMYGPYDFTFMFKGYKFIYLNTNAREFNFSPNVPDISWLDKQLADTSSYKQAIIVNHVPFNNDDFNPALRDDYYNTINKYPKTLISINGHNHNYVFTPSMMGSVPFLNTSSPKNGEFIILKIWEDQFTHRFVNE